MTTARNALRYVGIAAVGIFLLSVITPDLRQNLSGASELKVSKDLIHLSDRFMRLVKSPKAGVVEFKVEGVAYRLTSVDLDLDDFIESKAYSASDNCCGEVKITERDGSVTRRA